MTLEYWIGLYKLTATPFGTTAWYDGNPSRWRFWYQFDPDELTACIRYMPGGFRDKACSRIVYYLCKKAAGNFLLSLLSHAMQLSVYFSSTLNIHLSVTPKGRNF